MWSHLSCLLMVTCSSLSSLNTKSTNLRWGLADGTLLEPSLFFCLAFNYCVVLNKETWEWRDLSLLLCQSLSCLLVRGIAMRQSYCKTVCSLDCCRLLKTDARAFSSLFRLFERTSKTDLSIGKRWDFVAAFVFFVVTEYLSCSSQNLCFGLRVCGALACWDCMLECFSVP